jgi:C4-dicarboxylate-specific signal transduction histidine kinase
VSHSKSEKRKTGIRGSGRRLHPNARSRSVSPAPGESSLPENLVERILQHDRSLLLGKITAAAAHEIINPIAASLNLATLLHHILKEDGIPAERITDCRNYLSQIIRETGRAGKIAADILAFARTAGGSPRLVDLNEIVRQTFSLAYHLLKMEDVECRLTLADSLPSISCDAVGMRQALLNVLVNAAEAVEGCETRLVVVETRKDESGRCVILEVRDTGAGILPDTLPQIFEPFFTTRIQAGSLGLGLTVVRRIVQEHQGSLEVHSRPAQGTTVRITLPLPAA